MKRLLTALVSATLLATFFAGTPAPTFAAATEDYYIGYNDGPGSSGCGDVDFQVGSRSDDSLEDKLLDALSVVDDGDTIIICSGNYSLHDDMSPWDGNQGGDVDDVNPITITIRGSGDGSDTIIDGYRYDHYDCWDGDSWEDCYEPYVYNAFNFKNTYLTVSNLTFTRTHGDDGSAIYVDGGSLTVDGVRFDNYSVDGDGGAIGAWDADVSITDSVFDQTTGARDFRDIFASYYTLVGGDGGAVWFDHNDSTPKTLSIDGSTFDGNSSNGKGGAIWAWCADASITDTDFDDNSTGARGGAVYVESDGACEGDLEVANSTFEGNEIAGDWFGGPAKWRHMGGAIYSEGQDLNIDGSNFGVDGNGNEATNGGAIAMFDRTTGVANLTINDSYFDDNYSHGNGAALWLACVDATVTGDSDGTWENYIDGDSTTSFWSNYAENGGAIYLFGDGYDDSECPDGSQGSLTVNGAVFDDNEADYQGGAIHTQQSVIAVDRISIANSVFYTNYADGDGGALNSDNVNLSIDDSLFLDNESGDNEGGALEMSGDYTVLDISDSEFTDNYADGDGGAIWRTGWVGSGSDSIARSSFYSNESQDDDDGGALWTDATVGVSDSIFEDNTTGVDGEGGAIFWDGGVLTVTGSEFYNNYSWYYGGAIGADGGGDGLHVSDSVFEYNEARWDEGGAIHADVDGDNCPSYPCQTITRSTFRYNEAEGGGAIYSRDSIAISNSIFEHNSVSDNGGALKLRGGDDASITSSSFRFNEALWGYGGAVSLEGAQGKLTVAMSLFHDNSTGGGYSASSYYDGGAIRTSDVDHVLEVARTSFTENWAVDDGGAIYSTGSLKLSGSTLSRNVAYEGDGGGVYANTYANIESNTIRNNKAAYYGGGIFLDDATSDSVVSRNMIDANTAATGAGVAIFGYAIASNRMAIHTNSIWNNVATGDGGGLYMNFIGAGALYELANNMKSNIFVKNRANFGASGVNVVTSVTKASQRIFSALVKSSKYQLNRSTVRGADKLMLKKFVEPG